ncbi:MerR family DNA-binding transcriptional regulator, partial [Serratia ficaria]|uniref:MerR family DNA-binding transcriptional regulator n=1 Tax=Serratia ficaria TaxID=61651 RepID=UPI0021B7AF3E
MKELDIRKIADLTGVTPSALRYYEKKKLIKPVGRNGLRRQYKESVIPPCQDSCRLELKNFRGPETTKMNTYSPERKAALIARMMPPHNQSVVQLA